MKKLFAAILAIVMAVSVCVPVLAVDAIYAAVDLAGTSKTYNSGDTVNIVVSLCDIAFGDGDGVSALDFQLYFDSDLVEPVVTADTDSDGDKGVLGALMTKCPDGWEGFGRIFTEGSYYDAAFSDCSASSTVTLDGELVLTIPFKVKGDAKRDLVFRFENFSAYNKDMQESYEIKIPKIVMEYSITPSTTVELPTGAIPLDIAGYKHAVNNVIFYADRDTTVGDYVTKFVSAAQGQEKLSDFAIIIVDSNGVVTYASAVIGKDKSEIVIPKGSYIVAVHKDSEDFESFADVADEGRKVTLYNINVEATANVDVGTPLSNVGVVVGSYLPDVQPESDKLTANDGVDGHFALDGSVFVMIGNKITLSEFRSMFDRTDFDVLGTDGKDIADDAFVGTGMIIDLGTGISIVLLGDVDCDGEITAMDYILAKRAFFGHFTPDDIQKMACSMTNESNIVADDYICIKRIYFGMANLNNIYDTYWAK